jgi:hypothetical protein
LSSASIASLVCEEETLESISCSSSFDLDIVGMMMMKRVCIACVCA